MSSILAIGTVAFDALETPFGKTDKIIGGSATYICLAASYLNDGVNLVAVVGEDFAAADIENFQHHGINTDGLQIKKGEKSFFWSGKYYNDMNSRDTLVTELNVLENFDPIIPPSYQNSQYLMLGNLSPQVQLLTLERLTTRPKLVVLDTMNLWLDIALEPLKEVLKKIDVLSINESEARQLAGHYSLVKCAKIIAEMGPKTVIIKKGEHGALLFGPENQIFYAPALPLEEVFDPTGAGDTFAGGFIGYLAKTDDISFDNMKTAIIYGSALASFCVEKFGAERLLNLNKADLDARLKQFSALVNFNTAI